MCVPLARGRQPGLSCSSRSTWSSAIFCPELRQTDGQRRSASLPVSSVLCASPRGPATGLGSELSLSPKGLLASPWVRELTLNGP